VVTSLGIAWQRWKARATRYSTGIDNSQINRDKERSIFLQSRHVQRPVAFTGTSDPAQQLNTRRCASFLGHVGKAKRLLCRLSRNNLFMYISRTDQNERGLSQPLGQPPYLGSAGRILHTKFRDSRRGRIPDAQGVLYLAKPNKLIPSLMSHAIP